MPQWGLSSASQIDILISVESLGTRIKRLMETQRPLMTGRSLATALGKDPSYVSKLINDQLKDTPPPEVLAGLERVLGIPVVWSLCALGYAIEDACGIPVQSAGFPDGDPRVKAVEVLRNLGNADALRAVAVLEAMRANPVP